MNRFIHFEVKSNMFDCFWMFTVQRCEINGWFASMMPVSVIVFSASMLWKYEDFAF